jgi:hypothetical protein
MATYSTSLKLTLIGDGEQTGTWGSTTNTNLGTLLEQAIVGQTTIIMANADYTLTNLDGATDEARSAVIIVTGNQNATYSVTVPAVKKLYMVTNSLNSSAIAYIKMSGGTTTQVPNGRTMWLYCTGVVGSSWGSLDYVQYAQNIVAGGTITTGAINCASLTSSGAISGTTIGGTTITASTQFSGPGTGITGTAAGLSIGGTALNITASSNTSLTSLANLATVGTITSGTWSGSFGAVSGANLTNITGANVTGTVANATTAATVSTTVASGAVGTTQTAGDNSTKIATTAYVATAVTNATGSLGTMSTQNANAVAITGGTINGVTGTNAGMTVGTATTATTATSATSATTATNIAGGAANRVPYQSGAGATTFVAAPTVANTALTWNGSALAWATPPTASSWAYFQGGNGNTAGTILGSYNVSSITVNGTGDFTLNFTTALSNANYALVGGGQSDSTGATSSNVAVNNARVSSSRTTTTCRMCTFNTNTTSYQDFEFVSAVVIGG